MIKTNTSKSKTYELSEQNSEEKSDLNFPPDLDSQALLLQEFHEETESRMFATFRTTWDSPYQVKKKLHAIICTFLLQMIPRMDLNTSP